MGGFDDVETVRSTSIYKLYIHHKLLEKYSDNILTGIGSDCARLLRNEGRTGIETDACREELELPSAVDTKD